MAKKMKESGGFASMPQNEHKQMKEGEMGHECKLKYATEFGNPKDLDRSTEGLANYVRSHSMKY